MKDVLRFGDVALDKSTICSLRLHAILKPTALNRVTQSP